MQDHIYIAGLNGLCWGCSQARSQHPEFVCRFPVARRPAQIDRVMGGQLPKFEVRS